MTHPFGRRKNIMEKVVKSEESELTTKKIVKKDINVVKTEGLSDAEKRKVVTANIKIESVKQEESSSERKTKVGGEKPKRRGGPKTAENKEKILAYMSDQLQTLNRTCIQKQEIAEAIGYSRKGSYGFFYAYSELQAEKLVATVKGMGKLTESGIRSAPQDKFTFAQPKTNEEKQEAFFKLCRKRCKEGTDEKVKTIFDLFSDGKPHTLEELTSATGYRNKKSKGLGYNITTMEKDLKILAMTDQKDTWQFTDKCFPQGRP